jgi:CheY-like chemotaxis protein
MASILIVEDILAVRVSLKVVLQSDRHRITCAENGNQGLELLQSEPFDLVITDIWMPGANGADLIREGKAKSPRTRFLAITGGDPNTNGSRDAVRAQDFGADHVLLKPFTREELLSAVSHLLEGVAQAAI